MLSITNLSLRKFQTNANQKCFYRSKQETLLILSKPDDMPSSPCSFSLTYSIKILQGIIRMENKRRHVCNVLQRNKSRVITWKYDHSWKSLNTTSTVLAGFASLRCKTFHLMELIFPFFYAGLINEWVIRSTEFAYTCAHPRDSIYCVAGARSTVGRKEAWWWRGLQIKEHFVVYLIQDRPSSRLNLRASWPLRIEVMLLYKAAPRLWRQTMDNCNLRSSESFRDLSTFFKRISRVDS